MMSTHGSQFGAPLRISLTDIHLQCSQVPQLPWMSPPEASGLGNLTTSRSAWLGSVIASLLKASRDNNVHLSRTKCSNVQCSSLTGNGAALQRLLLGHHDQGSSSPLSWVPGRKVKNISKSTILTFESANYAKTWIDARHISKSFKMPKVNIPMFVRFIASFRVRPVSLSKEIKDLQISLSWSARDQSQQVRRESASGIVAHFSLMLMIITVATMVIIMIKATLILERRTRLFLFIQTPFGPCLRHLSFVVVSCISWHLPVVIDCISHPPLEIISHKILVWVWMAGQPYLRRLRTLEPGWLYTLTTGQLCIGEGGR